jgi:hypothetical protein
MVPDKVELTGPRSQVTAIKQIPTEPVDLASLGGGVHEMEVELLRPGGLLQLRRSAVKARLVVVADVAEGSSEDRDASSAHLPVGASRTAPGRGQGAPGAETESIR